MAAGGFGVTYYNWGTPEKGAPGYDDGTTVQNKHGTWTLTNGEWVDHTSEEQMANREAWIKSQNQSNLANAHGPNWLSTIGSIMNIFGIVSEISIYGPNPVNLGKADWASQTQSGMKFARTVSGAGVILSGVSMYQNGVNTSNSMDAYFGVVSFGGPVGSIISGVYFVGNMGTVAVTGETIGEHVDNNFYVIPTGALPGSPFIMIPKTE